MNTKITLNDRRKNPKATFQKNYKSIAKKRARYWDMEQLSR